MEGRALRISFYGFLSYPSVRTHFLADVYSHSLAPQSSRNKARQCRRRHLPLPVEFRTSIPKRIVEFPVRRLKTCDCGKAVDQPTHPGRDWLNPTRESKLWKDWRVDREPDWRTYDFRDSPFGWSDRTWTKLYHIVLCIITDVQPTLLINRKRRWRD